MMTSDETSVVVSPCPPSPPQVRQAALDVELRSIGRSSKVAVRRSRLSRLASFKTKCRLQSQQQAEQHQRESAGAGAKRAEVAERLLTVFRRSEDSVVKAYFRSQDYAADFLCLCEYAAAALKKDSKLLELRGPVHVFGDIHGNLEDLFFFRQKLWPAGMDLTAGKFLFMGDYVDRGMEGLEVLTYLFASKVCSPHKIFMLRGNHELRYVNGWESHYKEKSFLWQCKDRFGARLGNKVWKAANAVFDCLPLACTIDDSVFCSHGGIPRQRELPSNLASNLPSAPLAGGMDVDVDVDVVVDADADADVDGDDTSAQELALALAQAQVEAGPRDTRLSDIASLPASMKVTPLRLAGDADASADEQVNELEAWQVSLAMDLLWGDPCPSSTSAEAVREEDMGMQESDALDELGFGPGQRGGAAIMYGQRAVDDFFQKNGFSIMLRAHQASAAGISVSKNGKIVTVFSTSKDHALGDQSSCAYVLVEDQKVVAVNRLIEEPKPVPAAPRPVKAAAAAAEKMAEKVEGQKTAAKASPPASPTSPTTSKRFNKRSVNVFPLAAKMISSATGKSANTASASETAIAASDPTSPTASQAA